MTTKAKKRILFILPNLNAGGAERVAVTYLRQLDLEKYDVTLAVFSKTSDLLDLIPEAISLIDLRTNSTKKSFFSLAKLLRRLKPDIVFSTHSRVTTLLWAAKFFTPKFRHLARMQNTPSLEKNYGEYGLLTRWLYALGFRSADLVVAQTEEMRKDAIENFHISAQKITTLHNPIDTDHIDRCVKSAISPFPSGQVVAVASGRIDRQKGFDVLLRALPSILEHYPDFHLYILGNHHSAIGEIEALIRELALGQYVDLTGFVDNPYRYYRHCDLFVLSSRFEGFPNALIENYYLNTPIVATRCVPVVENLIAEGKNGFLCEVEDEECLARKTVKCIGLKRENIDNSYKTSSLEVLLDG